MKISKLDISNIIINKAAPSQPFPLAALLPLCGTYGGHLLPGKGVCLKYVLYLKEQDENIINVYSFGAKI